MSKYSVTVGMIALTMTAMAFAGADKGKGDDKKNPGAPTPVRTISFEEMKERCAHPEQFDVQRAPQNIRVQCSDTQYSWIAMESGQFQLPARRKVSETLFSDKFFVATQNRDVEVAAGSGTCQRFKEVEQRFTIERTLTCDELLGIKGDLTDYCVSILDSSKGSNPKLVDTKDTGSVLDTCGVVNHDNKGKK